MVRGFYHRSQVPIITQDYIRDEYLNPIPEAESHDPISAYHARLNSVDESTRVEAAKAWTKWEMSTSKLYVDPEFVQRADNDDFSK
ncbi:hypothetical protein AAF712_003312 [Marasmius tenuissimus]|uniref:Uncharacterized protein n=1 Tax=Marasmius tenuissimus TaxID=585030 RepID=A0ABR3A9I9_9AGAR